jgi:hypothetical protein
MHNGSNGDCQSRDRQGSDLEPQHGGGGPPKQRQRKQRQRKRRQLLGAAAADAAAADAAAARGDLAEACTEAQEKAEAKQQAESGQIEADSSSHEDEKAAGGRRRSEGEGKGDASSRVAAGHRTCERHVQKPTYIIERGAVPERKDGGSKAAEEKEETGKSWNSDALNFSVDTCSQREECMPSELDMKRRRPRKNKKSVVSKCLARPFLAVSSPLSQQDPCFAAMAEVCSSSGAVVGAGSGYTISTTSLDSQLLSNGSVYDSQAMVDPHSMVEMPTTQSKLARKKQARLAKKKELDKQEAVQKALNEEERRKQEVQKGEAHAAWLSDTIKQVEAIRCHDSWEGHGEKHTGVGAAHAVVAEKLAPKSPNGDPIVDDAISIATTYWHSGDRRDIIDEFLENRVLVYSREYVIGLATFEVNIVLQSLRDSGSKPLTPMSAHRDGPVDTVVSELSELLHLHDYAVLAPVQGSLFRGCRKICREAAQKIDILTTSIVASDATNLIHHLEALRAAFLQFYKLVPFSKILLKSMESCISLVSSIEEVFEESVASASLSTTCTMEEDFTRYDWLSAPNRLWLRISLS